MKYIAVVFLAVIGASLAFAGASREGSCTGSIVNSAVNIAYELDRIALDDAGVSSGNDTNVSAAISTPLKYGRVLNGGLGLSDGCGCS